MRTIIKTFKSYECFSWPRTDGFTSYYRKLAVGRLFCGSYNGWLFTDYCIANSSVLHSKVKTSANVFTLKFCSFFRSTLGACTGSQNKTVAIVMHIWTKLRYSKANNIGIKHGFSCIKIRQVPREVYKTEAGGRGLQHLPRDLANVNALKNHVRSLLLHKNWKHLLHFALFLALFCFAFSQMSRGRNLHGLCSF